MRSVLFNMLPTDYSLTNHAYLIYMYEKDLALNRLRENKCKIL